MLFYAIRAASDYRTVLDSDYAFIDASPILVVLLTRMGDWQYLKLAPKLFKRQIL